ncbi:hypothetical protein FOA52_001457 [Chlamydomonas sp. UWO 241]|nr:hypothetical protein FOA52_001457 [Chlamydomonas sp. UWO 241]UBZ25206.1 glutathione peroxidase [Chlamydomonas sp. UWO 241]
MCIPFFIVLVVISGAAYLVHSMRSSATDAAAGEGGKIEQAAGSRAHRTDAGRLAEMVEQRKHEAAGGTIRAGHAGDGTGQEGRPVLSRQDAKRHHQEVGGGADAHQAVTTGGSGEAASGTGGALGGLFALNATDIDGNVVQLSKYAGKVVVVVNVASACGFTDSNYAGLQRVYEKFRPQGVEILGFPCNQFGKQESGSEADIKAFCASKYHVTFPMFSKVEVNGGGTHPVYQFLKTALPASDGGGKDLGWNFFKFVVDASGQPVKLFPSKFDEVALEAELARLLQAAGDGVRIVGSEEDVTAPKADKVIPVVGNEQVDVKTPDESGANLKAPVNGLFGLSATDIDGNVVQLSKYAGKVVIVVNVASACGFTEANYAGLQQTYDKYKDHGLEILGFPCNQFGAQESGSEAEIKAFCTSKYHVTFPMFSKVEVNGGGAHPVYQFLKRELPVSEGGGGSTAGGTDLGWNFFKFVVNKRGQPVKLYPQAFDQAALEQMIYTLLHES